MPTDDHLLFALRASRDDAFQGDDRTTAELESRIARLWGKEAAMFGPSTTMTNRKSILG